MSFGIETSVVQLAAKVTIALAGAQFGHAALSKGNPRWQVLLWRVAAVGVAILLIAAALPPLYKVPLLPSAIVHSNPDSVGGVTSEKMTDSKVGMERPIEPLADLVSTPLEPGTDGLRNAMESAPSEVPAKPPIRESTANDFVLFDNNAATTHVSAKGDSHGWSIDWKICGWALYGLVLSVLLSRLCIGLLIARRAYNATVPAPDWVQTLSDQLAHDSRSTAIPVRVTDQFESPVLCGVLRKTILLPATMLRSPSAELDVRGAIAHEAAHAAGNDLFWDLFMGAISAFVWPHPLAWRIRAAHRAACERVSNRSAIDSVGNLAAYQSLVARIALRVSGSTSDIGLAMARSSEVRQRLISLASCPCVPRLGRLAMAIAVCATVSACVLGFGSLALRPADLNAAPTEPRTSEAIDEEKPKLEAQLKREDQPERSRPEALRFKVVHRDNSEPIANAEIAVRMFSGTEDIQRKLMTNADGEATFEYPDGDQSATLEAIVRRPGLTHVAKLGRNVIPSGLPIEKMIRMNRGKKVGGTVVGPEGNPVRGARVWMTLPAIDPPTESEYEQFDDMTKDDGTWLLDGAPEFLTGQNVHILHPLFIESWHPIQDRINGRYVLDSGVKLSGRVTDQNGNPVPSTKMTICLNPFDLPWKQTVSADEDGTYQVFALPTRPMGVTAEASGFAPQIKSIDLTDETKLLDFELTPGQISRFKVVNAAGEPLAGILVHAGSWKEFRSLSWRARTDADGLATWDGAPTDEVRFEVLGTGYANKRDVIVAPQEELHVIQLHRPLRISGTVTDSHKEKIPEFRIELGRIRGQNEISWFSTDVSMGHHGNFEFDYNEDCDQVYLRIEAAGFQPWTSEAIPFHKSNHKVLVRLESISEPAKIEVSPNGPSVSASKTAKSEARIRLVVPSLGEVERDLKWLIELSPTLDMKKQWKLLKEDLLNAFSQGVDDTKPISVDLIFRQHEMLYELRIPIAHLTDKEKGFLPNLKGIGFNIKTIGEGFYEVFEKNKKPYYLRYDKEYAWISSLKHAAPANPPLATHDLQPLLDLKEDLVADLKNDIAGLALRRANFKEFRRQVEALIKLKRNEDPNAVELRTLTMTQRLNEAERLLAETEELRLSWSTNSATRVRFGRGEISMTALPETDLLKSIEGFAVRPSYFANVTLHDNPLAMASLSFPLDAMRVGHLKEWFNSVRTVLEAEIATRPSPSTDSQIVASGRAMNLFGEMLDASVGLKLVDAFIDTYPVAPNSNVLVCGIRAANGKAADEIVKLIPQMHSEWQLKPDAREHGGVTIHELTVPKSHLVTFQTLFPGESSLFIGTGRDAVWAAAGFESLTRLKIAIDQTALPVPEKIGPVVLRYRIQVAKLAQLIEIDQNQRLLPQKEILKYCKLAQDSMSGCVSSISGELGRTDSRIEGYLELSECVLRFIGSIIADGTKQLQ